jgi:glycyl-tRNA synthetase
MQHSFQSIIIKLQEFWAGHGCLITQPYYTQVGAGTMNPATFLRVLGPEPWNVAYVEPSVRPDDGRYGENPNRFQVHYQYQVVLKPDPGNPQELYLESLKAIGIDPRQHDIRFVEDNWEQPAISAWGLGWEVWLDGQEITQFTYFQQVGGVTLDPVAVELTYGLERILIALNNAKAIWDEPWGAGVSYGETRKQEEYEHSKYYFEIADVDRVHKMYDLNKAEAEACLASGLVLPAHDYLLKCSHAFNTLDTRGAIGATERQAFFGQMRDLARRIAEAYLEQRKQLGYPLLKAQAPKTAVQRPLPESAAKPADFVLEIGTEELPAADVDAAVEQIKHIFEKNILRAYSLKYKSCSVYGTPRRLVVYVDSLEPRGETTFIEIKGPPESAAFKDGKPTQALIGWARKNELAISDDLLLPEILVQERDGGRYVVRQKETEGSTVAVLFPRVLPVFIRDIKFDKTMRWINHPDDELRKVSFSRPIRWLAALFGDTVIPFEYAGVSSGNQTRGLRPYDSPEIEIKSAEQYLDAIQEAGIVLNIEERKASIVEQVNRIAGFVGGEAMLDEDLLAEVTNLIEKPTAVLGNFNSEYLKLPREVLISVMKKQQRYFPLEKNGRLLPNFIAIRNGDDQYLDLVQQGNEHVLNARLADADFFIREDRRHRLEDFRPRLAALTFQTKLGSMLDKSERIEKLVRELLPMFDIGLASIEASYAVRAAFLSKADLATQMVTGMTSLQGYIGREYALKDNEPVSSTDAIAEQYLPVPQTKIGLVLAMADRLDSLVGLFAAGLAPTGAKDPFGLRRAAIGVVQPLIKKEIPFDLREAVKQAAKLQPINVTKELQDQVLDFLAGRLAVLLKDEGYRYDVVEAVLAEQSASPYFAHKAIRQLQVWVEREDWREILPAFARCVRITRDQKKKFKVVEKTFIEKEEKDLFKALKKAEKQARANGSVDDFLNAFVPIIPAVNTFFDKVLVMEKQKAVRENRLALLQRIAALADGVVDLSKLEGF